MSAELRGQGHPGWSCKTHESCRLSGNAQFTRPVHQERIEVGCSRDSLRSKSVLSYIKMLMGCKHGIGCSIVFGQVPFYLFSFTYPFPLHPSALSHCIVHSVRHIFFIVLNTTFTNYRHGQEDGGEKDTPAFPFRSWVNRKPVKFYITSRSAPVRNQSHAIICVRTRYTARIT
jgi:hypothetical protein